MYAGRRYYFITIAETLNITRAAQQLLVSQPSLTQYLNKLEADLGIKLVDRSFSPLRLTEAGQLYYEHLRKSRELEDSFNISLQKLKSRNAHPLIIGMPLQKSHELISRVLPSFAQAHPDVMLTIWEGTSSTVRERVVRGELDIGFGHTMDEEFSGCVVKPLNAEKLLLICHRDNPAAAGRPSSPVSTLRVEPEALNSQLFFQMSEEYYLYEVEARHMREHGVRPRHVTVMSNLRAIISSIASCPSDGFAYMPDYVFKELWPGSMMDKLAFLRLDDEDLSWNFSIFSRRSAPLSRAAKLFWDCAVDACCKP